MCFFYWEKDDKGTAVSVQPAKKEDDHDDQQACINQFGVPGQPVGQKDIEVVLLRIAIAPGQHRERAGPFENQQHDPFQGKQAQADPYPKPDVAGDSCIKQVRQYDIEEYPYKRMYCLDEEELSHE